jgi:hypothetical protein
MRIRIHILVSKLRLQPFHTFWLVICKLMILIFIGCESESGFLFDADADPGYQNDADPDPQHWAKIEVRIRISVDSHFWEGGR